MNTLPVETLARYMSYAYWRGRADQLGITEGSDKETVIETVGNADKSRWMVAADMLLGTSEQK